MESVYLRTLVEIVKSGSLSKAAETLCVTQPAVSRRIKFLEEQYGCPLFKRVGNAICPTDAGRLVVEKAEKLLGIESELLAELHSMTGKSKVSFCCTPAFGISHLPVIMKGFMLHYAGLMDMKFIFEIPENIVKGMNDGLFDLAVIEHCECFNLAGFSTRPLPDDSMIFISSPGLQIPPSITQLDQLLEKTLFTRKDGCCSRIMLEKNLKQIGHDIREFKKVVVFDDLQVIINAVIAGDGIAFISKDLVSNYLSINMLTEHQFTGFNHSRNRSLVFATRCSHNNCLDHFIDEILNHFQLIQAPS